MKKRYFIVAPQYDSDELHKICVTTARDSFLEIYWRDDYEEVKDTTDLKSAIRYCKLWGCKRVKVI